MGIKLRIHFHGYSAKQLKPRNKCVCTQYIVLAVYIQLWSSANRKRSIRSPKKFVLQRIPSRIALAKKHRKMPQYTHMQHSAQNGEKHTFFVRIQILGLNSDFFSLHSSRLPHSAQSHCGKYLAIHSRTYLEFFMDIRYILFAFEKCQSTKRNHFGLKYVPEQQYQQPHRSDRTCTVLESTHTRRIKCTYKMKLKTHTKR